MDICIFRIKYPNDPTENLSPHQHFIAFKSDNLIIFYSISSIFRKEYKVYPNGEDNADYYIFDDYDEFKKCNLNAPSFIDCTVSYSLVINNDININNLEFRDIDENIKNKILNKIEEVKKRGKHIEYSIDPKDFKKYNRKS